MTSFIKTHYASIGLVILGIGLILTGNVSAGIHSLLTGLAAFGIHSTILNSADPGAATHPLLDALWPLLAPVLTPSQPAPPPPKGPQTLQELLTAVQSPSAATPVNATTKQ